MSIGSNSGVIDFLEPIVTECLQRCILIITEFREFSGNVSVTLPIELRNRASSPETIHFQENNWFQMSFQICKPRLQCHFIHGKSVIESFGGLFVKHILTWNLFLGQILKIGYKTIFLE